MADPATSAEGADPVEGEATTDKTFVPPKDGSWVPREKLNKVLERLHRAEGQIEALKTSHTSPPNAPANRAPAKPVTRASLMAEVEAGRMTREQAETVWENQIVRKATENAISHVAQVSQQTTVQARLAEYEERFPDLRDPDSDLFKAATAELAGMLNTGLPDTLATTLVAVEKALGLLARTKAPRPGGEPNAEGGSSGYGAAGPVRKPGEPIKWGDLDKRQQDYYDKCIEHGQYADRAAVLKTLTKYPPKPRVVMR